MNRALAYCNESSARPATLVVAMLLVAACGTAGVGGNPGPPAPAPSYRVGDRWTWHGEQGYRQKIIWDETHEITAIGPDGITVKVTAVGPGVNVARTEQWQAPGIVRIGAAFEDETDRFDPALIRYKFPLTPGDSWQQRIRDLDKPPGPYGPIVRHVTVGGYESVTTPAGTFDAVKLSVVMTLDDETFYRYASDCTSVIWYAPATGAAVQVQNRSQYREKGEQNGGVYHPGVLSELRLTSYTRGP